MTTLDLRIWIVIVAGGVLTYALRGSFIFTYNRFNDIPDAFERSLEFVPAAVLAALVLPGLLVQNGQVVASPTNSRLLAGAIAFSVAWTTEDMLATIVAGMVAFWGLQFVV